MDYKISLIDEGALANASLSRKVVGVSHLTSKLITEKPWSPFLLKEGEGWLTGGNFESVSLLVFDIDNSPGSSFLSLDEAVIRFADYKNVIGTSRNHKLPKKTNSGKEKPAADRFRLILFFDQAIVDAKVYKHNWDYYVKAFKLQNVVDNTQDTARFFYPCKTIVSNNEGLILPVVPLTIAAKEETRKITEEASGELGRLTRKTTDFLLQMDNNNVDWHKKFVRAALDMKGKGYSYDEAKIQLTKASSEGELDATHDIPQLQDIYEKRQSYFQEYAKTQEWPEMIEKKGSFRPKPDSVLNIEHAVLNIRKHKLSYNKRLARIEKENGEPFTDKDTLKIKHLLLSAGVSQNDRSIDLVVNNLAYDNEYDPFKRVFEDTPWDGIDHMEALFQTLKFHEDEPEENLFWYREFFKRWLRGMAAKYYKPGSQNNVLIFTATQGIGKSRWLERLGSVWPEGYKEGSVEPSNKDHALAHLEKFLWHISELDNTTNNKDVSALKDFLTRETISERRPYAKISETGKSICSFCATVNSTDFLHDTSGNRRYLILPISGIIPDHRVDIPQVFAQAAAEYLRGQPWFFNFEEIRKIEHITDLYRYKDAITERLENALKEGKDRLTVHEIIKLIRTEDDNLQYINSRSFKISVSNMLQKKGFVFKKHQSRKVYAIDAEALKQATIRPVSEQTSLKWRQ